MGVGRVWARKFEFGENPFFGKNIFLLLGQVNTQNACPFGHTYKFFFSSPSGILWVVLTSRFLPVCVHLHDFGLLAIFFTIIRPRLEHSLSNGCKFLCVEAALLGLMCVLSLMWAVISSFSSGWGICFCNDVWLGFFPHSFCCISPSSSKMGFVLVIPSGLRKRPHSLVFEFHFCPR